jgi:hypothetical protein
MDGPPSQPPSQPLPQPPVLEPVPHTSPVAETKTAAFPANPVTGIIAAPPSSSTTPTKAARARRKSVDEMSRMLDEMIQDRVERGDMVRGSRGSVRLARDRRQSSLGYTSASIGDAPGTAPDRPPRPVVGPLSHEAPAALS